MSEQLLRKVPKQTSLNFSERGGIMRGIKMTTYVVCKTGSSAVFKVTASDQGHYQGPSGALVTYCNISCLF